MAVIIIDGSTVRAFVNDVVQFRSSVDERFLSLDTNNDGVLSRSEMRKAFEVMRLMLDCDSGVDNNNGSVDIEEFRSEVKKMMLALADGIGPSPMQMVVGDDDQNFLIKAADLEASKRF